jgi:hypothetical protein
MQSGYRPRMAADPDDRLPDTALATGNDDGEPGEQLGGGTLDPEEQAVLDDLRRGGGQEVVTEAEEDTRAMQDAVEDDSVVRGED